jgi:hypothetical protein
VQTFSAEWGGDRAPPKPTHLAGQSCAQQEHCDGENPMTGRPCLNDHHKGFHCDVLGAEWLDG